MRSAGWVAAVSVVALVSACAPADDIFGNPADGYVDDAVTITDAADWTGAEVVVVELSEFRFSPESLTFHKGRPYALRLTNTGSIGHRFMARGFFRAIAIRSVVYADGEAGYPVLEAIGMEPKETKTINFIPVISGIFPVSCDRPFHSVFGMEGRIVIQ